MGCIKKVFEFIKSLFYKRAVRYLVSGNYGVAKWSPVNDYVLIRDSFEKIVWVYSCVSLIATSVANVPWLLYKKNPDGSLLEIEDHQILNLLNKKANDNLSSRDFFELWATYLALNGKFFAKFNSPLNPDTIEPLIPYYTKPIPSKEDFISGLEYRIGSELQEYSKNLVLWSRFIDPLDFYEGLSPIKAQARILDTENSAIDWNKKTLDNSGVPPGALMVDSPTPDQIEGIRAKWKENYMGANNNRMPLIIDSEKANYIPFGINAVEMDFILQKKVNRIEICSGFGVPGQVVGDPEGQTYANYSEALEAFWKNTVIPKYLNKIKCDLNQILLPKFITLNENYYIDYNLDNIEVLTENQNEKTDRVLKMWDSDFLTLNEARGELGWEKLEYGDNLKSSLMSVIMPDMESGDADMESSDADMENEDQEEAKNTEEVIPA